ncbi:MAG: hypothetical protein R6U56_07640 [Opitutales bacterium]
MTITIPRRFAGFLKYLSEGILRNHVVDAYDCNAISLPTVHPGVITPTERGSAFERASRRSVSFGGAIFRTVEPNSPLGSGDESPRLLKISPRNDGGAKKRFRFESFFL